MDKKEFQVPFVCGAKDLGEALRRIAEGASMIRTKENQVWGYRPSCSSYAYDESGNSPHSKSTCGRDFMLLPRTYKFL